MKRKALILFFLLFLVSWSTTKSQFIKQINGMGYQDVRDIALDNQGNIYLTGSFQDSTDFGNGIIKTSVNNSIDYFCAKFDSVGNPLWVFTGGDQGEEMGFKVFIDTSDASSYFNYAYLYTPGGSIWGFSKMDPDNIQSWHFYLSSLSAYPVNFSDFKVVGSIIKLLIIVPAKISTLESIDTVTSLSKFSNYDGNLLYLEVDKTKGSILYSNNFSYPNLNIKDAKFDNNNIVISGGFGDSTIIDTFHLVTALPTNGLRSDAFLASIKTNGSCNWVKQMNYAITASHEEATGLTIDGSKIYFLQSRFVFPYMYGNIACYEPSSNTLVVNTTETIYYQLSNDKTWLKTKKVANNKIMANFSYESTSMQYFVFETSSLLKDDSFVSYPTGLNVRTRSFALDAQNNLFLAGEFTGNAVFDNQTLTSINIDMDGFLWKKDQYYYSPVSVVENNVLSLGVNLMPNPANSSTRISYDLKNSEKTTIFISDITGRTMQTINQGLQNKGNYTVDLDLSNLDSGTYFCTLLTATTKNTKKLVVVK